mmetsp:Transcript_101968/g.287826  ORF Transcript_101968/g.287826 Transcript_101968/m.287826 type:complete len:644 (+) Transcript_101968:65-1996(+)
MLAWLGKRRPSVFLAALLGVVSSVLFGNVRFVVPSQAPQRPATFPSQVYRCFPVGLAAPMHGHDASFRVAAGLMFAGAVLCLGMARGRRSTSPCRAGKVQLRGADAGVDATVDVVPPRERLDAVHITGHTMAAVLKMRCDITGADYAIFWVHVNGKLVVAGDYTTPAWSAELRAAGKIESFAERSESVTYDVKELVHVSAVYNLGAPMFVSGAGSTADEDFQRKDLAAEYGVKSICFVPAEAGVLEFGTRESWSGIPSCPMMPKREMRNAFEDLGASYVMFWAESDGEFSVIAHYVTEERRTALKSRRGDDKTFCTESRKFKIKSSDDCPMSTVAKCGQPFYVPISMEESERADLAREFNIKGMHLVPISAGVLECGISAGDMLSGNTLQAALKMRCENSGAGYALYWIEEDGEFVVAGSYVLPAWQTALAEKGLKGGFVAESKEMHLDAEGSGPIATTASFQEPTFMHDAPSEDFKRKDLAKKYGVESICFRPVPGGVMEFGTSNGPETATWNGMPACPELPKGEMKKAFNEFKADYVIFWVWLDGRYVVGAGFVTPDHKRALRNARDDDTSFADVSQLFEEPSDDTNYAWRAATSGKEIIIKDPANDPNLQRSVFAKEFRINEIRFVPCKDGVLEYGKSSY